MAYEESKYQVIKSSADYEIRKYDNRLAVEVEHGNENSGFRYLFDYISGENKGTQKISMTTPVTQSVKIDMTTPVTESQKGDKMMMQFYLPSEFTMKNAPAPTNKKVRLVMIEGGHYAVVKYSGRSTDKNYKKHLQILKTLLKNENITFKEQEGIKATFNGPFTIPFLRRNEAMIKINWK